MAQGKSAGKRGGENMSPLKEKKKQVVSMSKEDLDNAIASAVKAAMLEQQKNLNLGIQTAVTEAVNNILIPQLAELRTQIQHAEDNLGDIAKDVDTSRKAIQNNTAKVDNLQAALRASKHEANALQQQVGDLTSRLTQMEDRSRMSNLRLIGLKEGEEGSNAADFLVTNLPKWIPSLLGRTIRIERAHRLYSAETTTNSNRPRTLIFKLLDYTDRQAILKGARAHPAKHADQNLLFFPDYSRDTTNKRKAFVPVYKKMTSLGLQPFLRYPAQLKVTYQSRLFHFDTPSDAENFLQNTFQRAPIPQRNGASVLQEPDEMDASSPQ